MRVARVHRAWIGRMVDGRVEYASPVQVESFQMEGLTTMPQAPRDVDIDQWLHDIGFHPANTPEKQVAHEAARKLVAAFGTLLHSLLPAGRDKSLVFTGLEDVLMRANRALAIEGGSPLSMADLQAIVSDFPEGLPLYQDERIEQYKQDQLKARESVPGVPAAE